MVQHYCHELMGFLSFFKEVLNRLLMYGNGYSMSIVLDHRSTAPSLTGKQWSDNYALR